MNISRDEARRIAMLAHLEFDDAELDRLAIEMTSILGYIDRLGESSGDGEGPVGTPALQSLREDVSRLSGVEPERNAPRWDKGFFVVPKVIE